MSFIQAGKFLQAEELSLEGSHKPLGFGVPLGIVLAGKDLINVGGSGIAFSIAMLGETKLR